MKSIGLIGGVSWHSTMEYYRYINELIHKRQGGYHSAKMNIYSFNFAEVRKLHDTSKAELCERLIEAAKILQRSGSDCLLIGANTLHMFYNEIQHQISIPIIHIADAVGEQIYKNGISNVGLLGTIDTMEQSFYFDRLKKHGIDALAPDIADRNVLNEIIFHELVKGLILKKSKVVIQNMIYKMVEENEIKGVILACTEIPLILNSNSISLPVFNSTYLHAESAVSFALG